MVEKEFGGAMPAEVFLDSALGAPIEAEREEIKREREEIERESDTTPQNEWRVAHPSRRKVDTE